MTKRLLATLALALSVLACGADEGPTGDIVPLFAGAPDGHTVGCYPTWSTGLLTIDPNYGTAIDRPNDTETLPVAWPPGYSARKVGSEIAVLDPQGNVVATTGNTYRFDGAGVSAAVWSGLPTRMFWACGSVLPQ